jgi:hypothetical protein
MFLQPELCALLHASLCTICRRYREDGYHVVPPVSVLPPPDVQMFPELRRGVSSEQEGDICQGQVSERKLPSQAEGLGALHGESLKILQP